MNTDILISNITNPTLLFFLLGVVAATVKSDLEIPASSSRFISLYLLFSIGFRGGEELAHSGITKEVAVTLAAAIVLAMLVPMYSFFILKRKLAVPDAGAVAAAYGSVSAVTFVAAASFLEGQQVLFGGHMLAVLALMEAPAIIMGVVLIRKFEPSIGERGKMGNIFRHSLTNGSVL